MSNVDSVLVLLENCVLSSPRVEGTLGDQIGTWKEFTSENVTSAQSTPREDLRHSVILNPFRGSLFKAELCQSVHLMTRIMIGF